MDLAESEKHRLEEKQRARRKEYEREGKSHEAVWFEIDRDSKEEVYVTKRERNYWVERRSGRWDKCLDIY